MLIRAVTAAFGTAALCWSLTAAQIFRAAEPLESLAQQIIAGEAFAEDTLVRAAEFRDAIPPPSFEHAALARSAAILQLRLVETALDRVDQTGLDARMGPLRGAVQKALVTSPADSFLWLTRYWLTNNELGFSPNNLPLLAASYEFGPREGWLAARRAQLALTVFAQLDTPTQQRVVDEFTAMVDTGFTSAAADNLAGPGWPQRDRLVAGLAKVDPVAKQALAKYLFNQGINLAIPGVPELEDRPWR